jgi:hypothetical protein
LWYAGRLELDWRPRTVQEMNGIFESLGLADEFWRIDP